MENKYVSFVSDEDFLECVLYVYDAYVKCKSELDMKKLQNQVIDPFKVVFDVYNYGYSVDEWTLTEKVRQDDKTVNNTIGEFHQKLLGKVDGWTDLGTGHPTKVDLMNEDENIFIEIKNKWNTVNGGSKNKVRDNLEAIVKENPKATAYWAYIVAKIRPVDRVWVHSGYPYNERIKEICGRYVYGLVTEDPNTLDETWQALPIALNDIIKSDLDGEEKNKLKWFFRYAFNHPERKPLLERGIEQTKLI